MHVYTSSFWVLLRGECEAGAFTDDRPETLLFPRESDGREPLCELYDGPSFLSPMGRLNGSFGGSTVGVVMLSVKYCSEDMDTSGGGIGISLIRGNEVPGVNSVASGLKEKARGEERGERRNCVVVFVGGGARVDARERARDSVRESPRISSLLSARCIEPALLV